MKNVIGAAVAAMALSATALTTRAQDYPARPVQIIQSLPAGTGTDILSRTLAQVFDARFNQRFLVVNREGNGVMVAAAALAIKVDGVVRDLSHRLAADAAVQIITRDHPDALELIRHDAAHVMAEAVQSLYPGTQVTIGPAIENGFYYDFYRVDDEGQPKPFTVDDLPAGVVGISAEATRLDPAAHRVIADPEQLCCLTHPKLRHRTAL